MEKDTRTLDQAFCEYLEWIVIGNAFEVLSRTDERLKGFWCDGVIPPDIENEYLKKQVHDKRCVVMKAFAGKTGQEEYELTVLFGRKALSRYSRNLRLEECVYATETSDWFEVDPIKKKIVVQLA